MSVSYKELESLRVGDIVKIKIDLGSHIKEPVEKTVRLTAVKAHKIYVNSDNRFVLPIIEWDGNDNTIDPLTKVVQNGKTWDMCNAHYVTEIIHRAPYKIGENFIKNSCYNTRVSSDIEKYNSLKHAGKYGISVNELAQMIITSDPSLNIPYGYDHDKVYDLWLKDGKPGLKGQLKWRENQRPQEHTLFKSYILSVNSDLEEGFQISLIKKSSFKKWLLKRLPHIAMSKKQYKNMIIEYQNL